MEFITAKKLPSRALQCLLAIVLAFGMVPLAQADTVTPLSAGFVSHVGPVQEDYDNKNPSGGAAHSRYMEVTVNGESRMAICAEHEMSPPNYGSSISSLGTVTNDDMRRVLFYGYNGPQDQGYSLVRTATALSAANGHMVTSLAWDMINAVRALPAPPASFVVTMWSPGAGVQKVCTWSYNPVGGINSLKASSNPDMTTGNACYSLAGAVYGVYGNAACTDKRFEMTTDASGWWQSDMDVPVGTYWVKEITPPMGYALDANSYQVAVADGVYTRVNGDRVYDKPQGDPAGSLLAKYDGEKTFSANNLPQGSASLALAKYQVKYYAGYYTTEVEALASGTLKRSWVMQTNEKGITDLRAGDGTFTIKDSSTHPYKVSGDNFYRAANGDITLPMGTITIQEIKAPEGYLLPTPNPVFVQQITAGGITGEDVNTYNMPTTPEPVKRGDISLTKIAEKVPTAGGSGIKDPLVGVDFNIINSNDNPVVRPDKTLAAKGEIVTTITTDDRGYAATTGGALAYGSYTVHEVASTVPAGYATIDDFTTTITDDGQEHYYVLEDGTGTAIRIVKNDADTGKQIAGYMTFRILDENFKPVTFTRWYPTVSHMTAFTTDATGSCVLPEMLNGGKQYYIQEITAPEGYVLSDELIPFKPDGTGGWTYDNPLTITMTDKAQLGTITVSKTDSATGNPLAGATYEIAATQDIITNDGTVHAFMGDIVATITTNEDGKATSPELHLGAYEVYEVAQPDGYLLNKTRYPIELIYAGQSIEVTSAKQDTTNTPTRVEVSKTRKGINQPLAGVKFAHWNKVDEVASDTPVTEGSELIQFGKDEAAAYVPSDKITRALTDDDGKIVIEYLAPGTYGFAETATLPGYVLDSTIQYVTIDADGTIDGESMGLLKFENDFTKILISKVDAATGDPLVGASLELYTAPATGAVDIEGNPAKYGELIDSWISDTEPHSLDTLSGGDYILREVSAPDKYYLAEDKTITIDGTSTETIEVTYANDYTRTDVVKIAGDTKKPLAGAWLALKDATDAWLDPRDYIVPAPGEDMPAIDAIAFVGSSQVAQGHKPIAESGTTVWTLKDAYGNVVKAWTGVYPPADDLLRALASAGSGNRLDKTVEPDPNAAYCWQTKDKALRFEGLQPGSYTLVEIAPPDGYLFAKDVSFDVAATGDVVTVTMADDLAPIPPTPPTPEMPITGDALVGLLAILGAIACAAIVLGLAARKRSNAQQTAESLKNK